MRRAALPLLSIAATVAAAATFDRGAFQRGVEAVGTRPSDAIALRGQASPSPSFRLGAAFRAWRNAADAVAYDAVHTTGDGGDAEVLAEDCTDERIAFATLDKERTGLALTPEAIAGAGSIEPAAITTRLAAAPKACR